MEDVIWVDVEGYPNYAVSNHGSVRSLVYEELLEPRNNGSGYFRVALSEKGKVRDFYIHQLVARAFFESFRDGTHITHLDGDHGNNAVWNLKLRRKRKRNSMGYSPKERTSSSRVRIKHTNMIFMTIRDCARHIGGDYSSIYRCLRGERRHHLGYEFEYYDDEMEDA